MIINIVYCKRRLISRDSTNQTNTATKNENQVVPLLELEEKHKVRTNPEGGIGP